MFYNKNVTKLCLLVLNCLFKITESLFVLKTGRTGKPAAQRKNIFISNVYFCRKFHDRKFSHKWQGVLAVIMRSLNSRTGFSLHIGPSNQIQKLGGKM